ncbi:MAG: ECF transporter S component [Anaerorhabdus sp.]
MTKNNKIKRMTKIAILSVIAFVLMIFEFPLPIAPSFYKMDFSEVAVLIGGFALGPLAAVSIESLKILFNVLYNGSTTGYVGEIANLLIGIALVVPASYYYFKLNKTFKGAVYGLILGSISMVIIGGLLNYFIILPMYSNYGFPIEQIVLLGQNIFPYIKDSLTFVLFATSPFNALKAVMVSIVTIIMYKRVSPLLK